MAAVDIVEWGQASTDVDDINPVTASVGVLAAIAELPASGGRLVIYAGSANYELVTPIVIDRDNVEIICAPGVVFEQSSSWITGPTALIDFAGFANCTWRGGSFNLGEGMTYDLTAINVIENVATSEGSNDGFTVEGVTFDLSGAAANELAGLQLIRVEGVTGETRWARIRNNNFELSGTLSSNGVTGIFLLECALSDVSSNKFGSVISPVAAQSHQHGIHFVGGRFNQIDSNVFLNVRGRQGVPFARMAHIFLQDNDGEAGHTNITRNIFESSDADDGIEFSILMEGCDFTNIDCNNFGRQVDSLATIKAEAKSSGVLGRGLNITGNQFHAQITSSAATLSHPIHIDGFERVNIQGNMMANWDAITQDFVRVDPPAKLVVFNDNTNPAFPGAQANPLNRQRSPVNFRGPRNQEWVENVYPGTRNY